MDACLFGCASVLVWASWEWNSKQKNRFFRKPRDCQSIAGFSVFNSKPANKMKNMNKNQVRAPIRFVPEARFEQRSAPPSPFRATRENDFDRLKNQLLTQQLAEMPVTELNTPLRHAANEAAALAWVTLYPLLVFPVLFEEKTATAVRQAKRQARIFKNSREHLAV